MEQTSTPLFFFFRTWLKALVLTMALMAPFMAQAQTAETIFRETVGSNPLGTVNFYETNNYFDNDDLAISGSASVAKTTPSNYSGASRTNYIDNGSTNDFIISGINTIDYTSLKLGFGVNVGNKTTVSIEYSVAGGGAWQALTYSLPAAGSGWVYLSEQTIGALPASANLTIRFTASKVGTGIAGKLLIDDISLTGVYSPPPPTGPVITGFKPASGGVEREVTVYGYNLENAFLVYFEKSQAIAEAYDITSDSLKFKVPTDASTDVIQLYDVNGEILLATSTEEFVVIRPIISSFSPNSGSPRPVGVQGDEVVITGTNLATATSVVFGGAGSATPHYTSDTEVKVYIPDAAATGAIDVVTSEYGTATSNEVFTVLKPSITSLNSTAGATKNSGKVGETLVIKGQRLDVAPVSVTFGGGVAATTITASTSSGVTELRVTVPSGAQTGLITVTTAEGTATSTTFTMLYPVITVQNTPLEPFATKAGVASESQFYTISGKNLEGGINVTAPTGFQISKDNTNWSDPVFFPIDANGTVTQKYVFVRYNPSAKGTHSGNINNTSVSLTQLVAVSGSTLDPTITVSGTLSEFATEVGTPSASQSYTVSGVNMEGGIAVAAPATGEFKVSLDNATFTRTVFVPLPGGSTSIAETTVYVRYEPTEAGTHSGNIVQSSTNATDVSVSASGNTSKGTLPVELVSFKAERHGSEVTLLWATASEQDNSHFEVEMANSPSAGFRSIGRVNSKAGSSAIMTNYLLKYSLPGAGTRYFRLKQVDVNGTFTYSKVVAVEMEAAASLGVTVAPNPLNYNSKVLVQAHAGGKATVSLHNLAGKRLYHQTTEVKEGQNELQLPLYDQLPNGLYILTVELKGQRQQVKVVKQ